MCGGTVGTELTGTYASGLSPRVRGNPVLNYLPADNPGSIPTCAGEPLRSSLTMFSSRVYPHVCGGTPLPYAVPSNALGLSPRVRGNPFRRRPAVFSAGSIPTCAGEPVTSPPYDDLREVYPHVCGGTSSMPLARVRVKGLSPRVRGNLARAEPFFALARSIPTCAGEPTPNPSTRGSKKVYPHVCGGTCQAGAPAVFPNGLSPRVRGNLCLAWIAHRPMGSIPTCAGEPGPCVARGVAPGVYPHVCGGTG